MNRRTVFATLFGFGVVNKKIAMEDDASLGVDIKPFVTIKDDNNCLKLNAEGVRFYHNGYLTKEIRG